MAGSEQSSFSGEEADDTTPDRERPVDEAGQPVPPPHRLRCRAVRDYDVRRCVNPRAAGEEFCALHLATVTITTIDDVPPRPDRGASADDESEES